MRLLAGLGNPGDQYKNNRHNVGFMAVERIAHRHNFSASRKRFQADVMEGRIGSQKVLLMKPQTFMNNSGQAVGEAMRFYKLDPADVTILYDELDLAPFKVKVKTGGGAAGHNGIRSISQHIGPDYERVRIGIGHPGDKSRVQGHVLGDFAKSEAEPLDDLLNAIADTASWLVDDNPARFMTELALLLTGDRNHKPKGKKPDKTSDTVQTQSARKNSIAASDTAQKKAQNSGGAMADALKALFKKKD